MVKTKKGGRLAATALFHGFDLGFDLKA